MINMDDAKSKGFNIIDSNKYSDISNNEIIERIKKIIPNVINSDNVLNIKALNDLIDISKTSANNQGYELTFAGKGLAKALADIPTKKELKIEKDQSKKFNETGNVIIRGDNIDALKILKQNYYNKIKMIYIDPPYNTASDEFIYKDNFKESDAGLIEKFDLNEDNINYLSNIYGTRTHSGWLSFMYPRLKIARDLLTDDGVIFINIDNNEQANLKIICDEIFGEENSIGQFIWRKKGGGGQTDDFFVTEHEYILVYRKSNEFEWKDEYIDDNEDNYNKIDSNGKFKLIKLAKWGSGSRKEDRPSMHFPLKAPDNSDVYPIAPDGNDGRWRVGIKRMNEIINQNLIYWGENNNNWIAYEKIYFDENKLKVNKIRSILYEVASTADGANELKNLFIVKDVFENPKPTNLIKTFLKNNINNENSEIILDFFAGSGTTAHAVMDLNKEDGGNRKFILIQIDEKIDKRRPGYDFCIKNNIEPIISSITIERVNRAGNKLKDDLLCQDLDIGYKVFSLIDKLEIKYDKDHFELFGHRINIMDTLYNMMSATAQILDSKIIEIEKDKLYKVSNNFYLLGKCENNIAEFKDSTIYIDGYSNFKLEDFLNFDVVNKENIKIIY